MQEVGEGRHAVYGTVVDGAGRPVNDARVELGGFGTESFSEVSQDTTTNLRGEYHFAGVEVGMYMMEVWKEG